MIARKGQNRVANQMTRKVKNLTAVLTTAATTTTKETKCSNKCVGEYKNACEIER